MSTIERAAPSTRDLGSRLALETLTAELSSRFINVPPGGLDREIEDALRRLSELLRIDLAVLWQWSDTVSDVVSPTHVYYAKGRADPPEPIQQQHFPWYVRQVLAGHVVGISSLAELPAEAAVDVEHARRLGIKSNLCLPLSVGSEPPVGALAFNTLRAHRDWPDVLVKRLQLVAAIFANALARRRADQALRESEEINRATFDQAAVGIAHVATDGRCLRVNDKLCAIVGYPREELLGLTFQDITHPDDLETDLKRMRQVLAGRIKTYSMENRFIRKDGSLVQIHLTVSLVRTGAGEPRHFISVLEDITERKRAEEALRASEARLAAGADVAGIAFVEVDFGTGMVFADDRFRTLCGIPPDREQGLEIVEFWKEHLHPDDAPRVLDERQKAADGKQELSLEYRYLHPSRGEVWIRHIGRAAARDASGRAVKTFSVLRDITERRRAEEALRKSYTEIEQLRDRLQAERDYLKAEIGVVLAQSEITGQSPAIQKVRRLVEQVAPTDSSVLVRGETGTGKELVAQAIHQLSTRRHHVMVKVNCAALPSGLVESELFGRERGAYTGALTRQVGRFEVADGSTIFLDEIGELSLEMQAKLLRVLERGEFERLGSPRTIKANVRVIAATNRDLAEDIQESRFREDLYYRLNVFPIRVPPLRERAEDIPLLVWTFLEEISSRMGKKITQIPRKTMKALQRHPWPGNVRQLRNVIEHGAILTTGDTLRVPVLEEVAPGAAQPQTLADAQREHILRALERTSWHVKGPRGAAAELGLKPATLYSRMKKLGIQPRRQTDGGSA